jgi:hypothetical protein
VAICAGTPFVFDFSATDPDKDVLVYNLCSANNGGGQGNQSNGCTNCPAPIVASVPPYNPLPYNGSYSAVRQWGIGDYEFSNGDFIRNSTVNSGAICSYSLRI